MKAGWEKVDALPAPSLATVSHPSCGGILGWCCPGCAWAGAGAVGAPLPFPDRSAAGASSCLAPHTSTSLLRLSEQPHGKCLWFWRKGLQAVLSNPLLGHLGQWGPILLHLLQQVWTCSHLWAWHRAFCFLVLVLPGASGPHGPAAVGLRWVRCPSPWPVYRVPFWRCPVRPAGVLGEFQCHFVPVLIFKSSV